MSLRPLALPGLLALLCACAAEAPEPTPPPATQARTIPIPEAEPAPYMHVLQGKLLGVPAKAEVELALLQVDAGKPQRLLASVKLVGSGAPLPFRLGFNPESFPRGQTVELRGRASQSGQLILHLPARLIQSAESQSLGELQFVPAP
jgi:uncharacterized lipoprotein YbaY